MSILPYKIVNSILILLLFFIFIYGYKNFVYPIFGYSGFDYKENSLKFFETSVMLLLTLAMINFKKNTKFIYAVNMTILLFMTIPNYILFIFMEVPRVIIYSYFFLHLLIIIFAMIPIHFKSYRFKGKQGERLLLLFSLFLLIPFLVTYGVHLNFNVFLLKDIYEVRESSANQGNILTGYFYSWLSHVVLPFVIVYGYLNKKKIFIIIGILSTFYLFLVAAQKSVFFGLFVLLYLNFFKGYYEKIFALLFATFALVSFGLILHIVYDDLIVLSMFLRRVFFLPALLNQFYFDFFSDNYLYLSHSIFKYFIDYPYQYLPSHIIGLEYFNSIKMGANNGIISDGFMNFGYIGIMINMMIVAFLFGFFQAIKINELLFPIIVLFVFSINSSALLTVMLTHGLILFTIMVFFYNKKLNLGGSK